MSFVRWSWTYFGINGVLTTPVYSEDFVRYMIYQKERCPTSGREHYQGYVEMKTKCRFAAVQKALEITGAHCECSNGTAGHNEQYCSKKETWVDGPWRFGVPMKGKGKVDVSKPEPEVPRERPHVRIHWGEPNSGKTESAKRDFGTYFEYRPCPSGMWFCKYAGQKCILFDEMDKMDKTKIDWVTIFAMMDPGVMYLPIKGKGGVLAEHTTIVFTANAPVQAWVPDMYMRPFMSRVAVSRLYTIPHPMSTRPTVKYEVQAADGSFVDAMSIDEIKCIE